MTTSINIVPNMESFRRAVLDGVPARCRCVVVPVAPGRRTQPGKLDGYPSRVEHARAHRLRSEIRRRDRRRARTGRPPIRLRGHAHPRMLEITNALAPFDLTPLGSAIARAEQAARQFAAAAGPAIIAMQQRLNEAVHAAATATVPQRFIAGTTPEWSIYDDVAAYQRRVEAEFQGSRRADRERYYDERLRGGQIARQTRLAAGGVIHEHRDPDDDTIPVQISPGGRFQPSGPVFPGRIFTAPLGRPILDESGNPVGWRTTRFRDVTHYDRHLGEGALDRDETSGRHSLDSSGTGAVWSDLMTRIDDPVDGKE